MERPAWCSAWPKYVDRARGVRASRSGPPETWSGPGVLRRVPTRGDRSLPWRRERPLGEEHGKLGVAVAVAVGSPVALVATAVVAAGGSLTGGGDGTPATSSAATSNIPPAMLSLYEEAASTCPGLPWTVLAAIGTIESDNGLSTLPGVHERSKWRRGRGADAIRAGDLCRVRRARASGWRDAAEPLRPDGRGLQRRPGSCARTGPRAGRTFLAPSMRTTTPTPMSARF